MTRAQVAQDAPPARADGYGFSARAAIPTIQPERALRVTLADKAPGSACCDACASGDACEGGCGGSGGCGCSAAHDAAPHQGGGCAGKQVTSAGVSRTPERIPRPASSHTSPVRLRPPTRDFRSELVQRIADLEAAVRRDLDRVPPSTHFVLSRAILDSSSMVREHLAASGFKDLDAYLRAQANPAQFMERIIWTARFEHHMLQALESRGGLNLDAPMTYEGIVGAMLKLAGRRSAP